MDRDVRDQEAVAAHASRRGNGLDLDQEIRTVEFRYLDQCHGGRRRWRYRGEEAVSGFAVGAEIIHVGEEYRELYQIGWRAAAGLQRNREVSKHLLRLGCKIIAADHIAIAIERGLTGDEDDACGVDFDDLGIAGRRSELGWMMRVIWDMTGTS